jgi:hypothetical protein
VLCTGGAYRVAMTILHIAMDDHLAGTLHAAAVGDEVSLCGHSLGEVLDQDWDSAAQARACQRCQQAVEILRQISAV